MCTIMTFDAAFYRKNKNAVRRQIMSDAFGNGDGFSMLLMGTSSEDTNLIRSMNIEVLLAVLEFQMSQDNAERAWIHCRFATTAFVGLNGCHGFAAKDYTVFHNGVLSRDAADSFNVDSELIAFDIELAGVETAIKNLADHESYANVFIVNNQTGSYDVIRKSSGTLYTDGRGNYSTHKFASINRTVPQNSRTEFSEQIVEIKRPSYGYGSSWERWEYSDDRVSTSGTSGHYVNGVFKKNTDADLTARSQTSTFTGTGVYTPPEKRSEWTGPLAELPAPQEADLDLDAETTLIIDSLTHITAAEDFEELANYEGWAKTGIPYSIYENLNIKQLQWCRDMQLFPERTASSTAS